MKSTIRRAALLTTAISAVGFAQSATAADTAPANSAVEAVIVTAQKREQNVQDVPVAVQVLGSQQLAAAGVQNFEDLNRVAPTLDIRADVQPVNATVAIRGIGTYAYGIGVEPSVAIIVDDVPLAFQARAFSDLNDVERVEVLSGPQSTLYGKSSSAGLINIVTAAPTKSFTVKGGAMFTNDREGGGNLVVSGPVSDTAGFRVAVNYDNFAGNIQNKFNGKLINGHETVSARGKFAWDITDKLNVQLGVDFINGTTSTGRPFINVDPAARLRGVAANSPDVFAPGISFGPNNTNVYYDALTATRYEGAGESLKVSYDLGSATLMSISSHAHYKLHDAQDIDESAIPSLNNQISGIFKNDQITEELRLVSQPHQPLRYTLGAYYSNINYHRPFYRGPVYSLAKWFATEGGSDVSVFGQLEYDVTSKLTVIAGGRTGNEGIHYTFTDYNAAGTPNFSGHHSHGHNTWKLGLQYHVTDDMMAFATHSTGYKGETYDLTTGFNALRAAGGPVGPETSVDDEIGIRAQFLDRRLTINPTIYNTTYTGFQAQGAAILPDGTVNFRLFNVGSVRTRGIEVDGAYRFNRDFSINASAGFLDAIVTSFPNAQCYAGQTAALGCIPAVVGGAPAHQDVSGKRVPMAPKFKLSSSIDYEPHLGGSIQGIFRAAYSYQSGVIFGISQDPIQVEKGYGLLNISFGYRDTSANYELIGFVNNALGQHYYSNVINSVASYGSHTATEAILPRDFLTYAGFRLNFHY